MKLLESEVNARQTSADEAQLLHNLETRSSELLRDWNMLLRTPRNGSRESIT